MLQSISISNFQSLHSISLDLSRFTVIVGPSSSGKSAFTRALRTLANNRRGLDFLTHGARTCTITARNEHHTVTLSRGKGSEENYYRVIPTAQDPNAPAPAAQAQRYSKLEGKTPPEVTAALGIEQGTRPFASQHDSPYMLADSASANASALGRLTNVHVIFEAAREAKRQSLDASKRLRIRAEDLTSTTESLSGFDSLTEQHAALASAEKKISEAYTAARRLSSISTARDTLTTAAQTVKRLRTMAEAISIPDLTPAQQAHAAAQRLAAARQALTDAASAVRALRDRMHTLDEEQQAITDERAALRANTAQVFRTAFEQSSAATANYEDDGSVKWWDIDTESASKVAAQTVEDMNR